MIAAGERLPLKGSRRAAGVRPRDLARAVRRASVGDDARERRDGSGLAGSSPVVGGTVGRRVGAGPVGFAGAPARHAESGMSEPVASAQAAAPV